MITLQFSKRRGLGSQAIRWFTWSAFSHVDAVLADGRLLGATFEHGVALRPHDPAEYSRIERFAVDVPAEPVLYAAMSQIGKPYDWGALLGFALRSGSHHDAGAWFCSELWAWAFHQAGYPLLRTDHLHRISPRDLLLSPLLRSLVPQNRLQKNDAEDTHKGADDKTSE